MTEILWLTKEISFFKFINEGRAIDKEMKIGNEKLDDNDWCQLTKSLETIIKN